MNLCVSFMMKKFAGVNQIFGGMFNRSSDLKFKFLSFFFFINKPDKKKEKRRGGYHSSRKEIKQRNIGCL